jgi:precorrin-4 methylase
LKKLILITLVTAVTLFAKGELSIVSTGTGDLDNMTIKAYKAIENADIFFTMRGEAGKFKELIGDKPIYKSGHGFFKKGSNTRMTKEETKKAEDEVRSVIRKAYNDGKKIVMLENGDPTIYGPQMGYMQEFKDLNPKIIPGISSFNAANAALQNSVIGGLKNASGVTLTIGRDENTLIEKLAPTRSTMVFFMDRDFDEFIAHLLTMYPKDTPIAIVVEAGSKENEEVIIATLETIKSKVNSELSFNKLVYVGDFLR